jgi:hypothetical protein
MEGTYKGKSDSEGGPGKKDGLIGRRKVSSAAGARSLQQCHGCTKEDGAAGEWKKCNKGAGGGQSRGATTKATEASGKLEDVAGVGRKCGTGRIVF